MFSQNKQDDKEMLLEIADIIEVLAQVGTKEAWDLAEKFGEHYEMLETKISTHNYLPEDEISDRINARLKHENYASLRHD